MNFASTNGATQAVPVNAAAANLIGVLQMDVKNYAAAKASFEGAIKLFPEFADKSGSVEDVPAVKKEAKPTPATKGGSLDEMPKPVENKKVTVDQGSTKTE